MLQQPTANSEREQRRPERRREPSAALPRVVCEQRTEATPSPPTWARLPETQRVRLVATLGRMVQASRGRSATDE
jgi:hypothetical protein